MPEYVAIFDFGSQYTQLIARRVREEHVYCEILRHDTPADTLRQAIRRAGHSLKGIILSGGPAGVYEKEAPRLDPEILRLGVPNLGICYGMQIASKELGARVQASSSREYGATRLDILGDAPLFKGIGRSTTVWMSHGDRVESLEGASFETTARSDNSPHAAVLHRESGFRGLQFHPEVTHTPSGRQIIRNFLQEICGCRGDWSLSRFTEEKIVELRDEIGDRHVVCGLSGGVDSSVAAALLDRAIGSRLHCIFVDNGLLRGGEREQVIEAFRDLRLDLRAIDAAEIFLSRLSDVIDPEEKRKRIGHTFIEVFKKEAQNLDNVELLAQGTLYPDVIESLSPLGGPSATIKSHHNVGGLPAELGFELVEPLRFLFKDEVRVIGRELGLPDRLVERQPFPGPGLAIRVIGAVTHERLEMLRHADRIVQEEMEKLESYREIWQSFAVILPVQTVGVMGDRRTYDHVVALRIVESTDGMTANWVYLPREILERISSRISNEVSGVNRVVLDISSKPPSTIEWE